MNASVSLCLCVSVSAQGLRGYAASILSSLSLSLSYHDHGSEAVDCIIHPRATFLPVVICYGMVRGPCDHVGLPL